MGSAKNKDSTTSVTNLFSTTSQYRVDYKPVVDTASNSKRDTLIENNEQVIDPSAKKSKEKKVLNKDKRSSETSQEANGVETQRSEKKIGSKNKTEPTHIEKKKKLESRKRKSASEVKDDNLDKTIFVGNLSEKTTKKSLKAHFDRYGKIDSIRFRSMPVKEDVKVPKRVAAASGAIDSEKGSFHAYIVFKDAASVSKSLVENMNVLDDRHIRVDRAAVNMLQVKIVGADKGARAAAEVLSSGHQVKYDIPRTVFVGNVPLQIEDEDLIQFFIAGLGAGSESLIEAVRIVRDPKTMIGKGIAFVLFKNRAGWKAGLRLDGKALSGRKLRIMPASADPTESHQYKRVKKKTESWQGATATRSGRVRGSIGVRQAGNKAKIPGTRTVAKRIGKRPAVAARKLKKKNESS